MDKLAVKLLLFNNFSKECSVVILFTVGKVFIERTIFSCGSSGERSKVNELLAYSFGHFHVFIDII